MRMMTTFMAAAWGRTCRRRQCDVGDIAEGHEDPGTETYSRRMKVEKVYCCDTFAGTLTQDAEGFTFRYDDLGLGAKRRMARTTSTMRATRNWRT